MSKFNAIPRVDIYTKITNQILTALERGVRPWVQPWSTQHLKGRIQRPLRHNGEAYTGMNVLLLWSEAMANGFNSPTWMTMRQANEIGGHVRKGEHGAIVVFASRYTKTEYNSGGGEVERNVPFLKTYSVFNVDQIEGLPDHYHRPPEPRLDPVERIDHAERFFENTAAVIRHGGGQAFYTPGGDFIQMPPFESFRDAQSYIATLSHEFIHWTAHPRRVNRDLSRYAKNRTERAREELIAEIGSAFLCADLDIVPELEPRPDHFNYIGSWLSVLSNDKRAIFQASAHAQRAVAFLHGLQPQSSEIREAA